MFRRKPKLAVVPPPSPLELALATLAELSRQIDQRLAALQEQLRDRAAGELEPLQPPTEH